MKDDILNLRLPAALARAVGTWARRQGVAKSQVVREALVHYFAAGGGAGGSRVRRASAREVAARWRELAPLSPAEGAAFADDLERARRELPAPEARWG